MHSFSVEIGSRGYHVYRNANWTDVRLHQAITVEVETNATSRAYDPYCCKISIRKPDRIGPVTVGHIPRELSRYVFYFLHEGGLVTGTVSSVHYRQSPIPEGGLEIPIQMTFSHSSKPIVEKMKAFAETQLVKMEETFRMEVDENTDDEEIILEGEEEIYQNTPPPTMVVDIDPKTPPAASKQPMIIVIDDDDDEDDIGNGDDNHEGSPPSEERVCEEVDDEEVESDEALRARVRQEIDFILNAQAEAELEEPPVSILD